MAAVVQSAVTILRSWEDSNRAGQFSQQYVQAKVVLTAQGGTTGDMPAALFGLAEVYECTCYGINNAGTWSGADLILDGITVANPDQATGVVTVSYTTGLLANLTGTLYLSVTGRPL